MIGVVLCGGRGVRLGGEDKASLIRLGKTFLELAVEALAGCATVVAVGEERPGPEGLIWASESPPYGGPAAGLLAGLRAGLDVAGDPPSWVVALAVDMPAVTGDTIGRLLEARVEDGAILVDDTGRRQHLCAVYRIAPLLENAPASASGLPFHRLLAGLRVTEVRAVGVESRDVDEAADLEALDGIHPTRPN